MSRLTSVLVFFVTIVFSGESQIAFFWITGTAGANIGTTLQWPCGIPKTRAAAIREVSLLAQTPKSRSGKVLKNFAEGSEAMKTQLNQFYEFGSIRLDATNRLVYRDGVSLGVQPRVVETLLVLVKNANQIVDKDTLLDAVWRDAAVEEGGLKRNISLLR